MQPKSKLIKRITELEEQVKCLETKVVSLTKQLAEATKPKVSRRDDNDYLYYEDEYDFH